MRSVLAVPSSAAVPDFRKADGASSSASATGAVASEGVPESDTAGLWDQYRGAVLFCVCYPMIAGAGMDLTDERQRGLLGATFERFERAADELSLPDLL